MQIEGRLSTMLGLRSWTNFDVLIGSEDPTEAGSLKAGLWVFLLFGVSPILAILEVLLAAGISLGFQVGLERIPSGFFAGMLNLYLMAGFALCLQVGMVYLLTPAEAPKPTER